MMKINQQNHSLGSDNWSWKQLYGRAISQNKQLPYSLNIFKRNVRQFAKLSIIDQELLNRAKTRPAINSARDFSIYRIFHKISGRSYIGISDSFEERKVGHQTARGDNPLHRAIRHDGWSVFEAEVLVEATMTRTAARRVERAFILAENTLYPVGFNQRT
jgi:predicted GIY-YIG superfamily endonuclease